MNPDFPQTPREEMEARLTALLLGELSAEEAATVREAIAQDPDLAKLHDRLKETVGLVREAAVSQGEPMAAQAISLKLSAERREKLLAHFKTVKPMEFAQPRRRRVAPWLVQATATAAVMVLIAVIAIPLRVSQRAQREEAVALLDFGQRLDQAGVQTPLEKTEAEALSSTPWAWSSKDGDSDQLRSRGHFALAEEQARKVAPRLKPSTQIVLPTLGDSESSRGFAERYAIKAESGSQSAPVTSPPPEPAAGYRSPASAQAGRPSLWFDNSSVAPPPPAEVDRKSVAVTVNDGQPTTTLPADNFAVEGALVNRTVTASKDLSLERNSFGLFAGDGGTGGGAGRITGATRDGAVPATGADPARQLAPGQTVAGDFASGIVASPVLGATVEQVPALAMRPAQPELPTATTTAPTEVDADKTPVLGDLPAAGRFFRSVSPSSGSADRGLGAAPAKPAATESFSYDDLGTYAPQASSVKGVPVAAALPVPRVRGALAETDTPTAPLDSTDKKAGNISLGGRIAPDPDVQSVDVFGYAQVPLGETTAAAEGEVRRRASSVVLPPRPATTVAEPLVTEGRGTERIAGPKPVQTLVAAAGIATNQQERPEAAGKRLEDRALFESGRLGEAEIKLQDAVKTDPQNPLAFYYSSLAREDRGAGVERQQAQVARKEALQVEQLSENSSERGRYDRPGPDTPTELATARQRLEELERARTDLNLNLASKKIDVALPKSTAVEIVDKAKPASAPEQTFWGRISGGKAGDYASTARVKVEPDASDIAGFSDRQRSPAYDPYFVQSEFEAIQSEPVLGKVVDSLQLTEALGKQRGGVLKKQEAIALLKKKIEVKSVPNTSLVEIRAKSDKPEEAAKLANAVAEAYRDYRLGKGNQLAMGGINTLNYQLGEQEEMVAQAKGEVDRLQRQSKAAIADVDLPIRKPATNAPIPQPEIQTSDNAFSTFSLNVSDVSFKLAAASLEKGQMPDPASVRSEEFINAFDYRDPEPPPGVPVAFAWERARYPFAHNRDLLRFSLKTGAFGRQAGRPLNIVLLLDNSGSMERADRVSIIREALRVLASQLQPQDKLSVITFARTPRLWVDGVSGDKAGEVAEQISGLTPQGGTNLEDAMNLAYQTALRLYLATGINRVVLLTDGAANLGNVEPESLKQKVEAYRKQGIALDCFGIGWEGFNDDLLEVLSRNGDGRYGFINSPEEAATEFAGQLAGALQVAASDVKVQVEFNPKRVTAYRQIGYAKHQLTKEQFRDNTVDAAEIAAQEAGNALYTAEVNPAGAGPLCTVRVRYKIPGTTDYREQSWDVPFTGNAVSLEQSSPAMRLAASASAFAEWLVASPFAGEVTPDRLLNYLGSVPEVYGADARPKKLEWMIRQAKSLAGN